MEIAFIMMVAAACRLVPEAVCLAAGRLGPKARHERLLAKAGCCRPVGGTMIVDGCWITGGAVAAHPKAAAKRPLAWYWRSKCTSKAPGIDNQMMGAIKGRHCCVSARSFKPPRSVSCYCDAADEPAAAGSTGDP